MSKTTLTFNELTKKVVRLEESNAKRKAKVGELEEKVGEQAVALERPFGTPRLQA